MFNAGVNRALTAAAALINTEEGPRSATLTPDTLTTTGELRTFLDEQDPQLQWPTAKVTGKQLNAVLSLRATLRRVWEATPITDETGIELVNELLEGVGTKLVRDDDAPGRQPFGEAPVPVSNQVHHVMTATIAAGLSHLVVAEETARLRICRGEECEAAIVDLTRNRSKLFCDFGNCANRAHVRAYRARQAAQRGRSDSQGSRTGRTPQKPSSAEKAEELNHPTSVTAAAAKQFRNRMRDELMLKRQEAERKKKKSR